MNIAYLQSPYPDGETYSPQSTFAWILQETAAVKTETDLIVLPEYSNCPGINDYDDLRNFIRHDSKDFLRDLAKIAHDKSTFIAANITREVPNGLQNITVLLDREGSVVAEYQKVHLTEFEQKALHIISGDKVQIVEIENIRVAFATCFDIYFADYFAAIARQNPDLIIFPSYQRSEKRRVIVAQTAARAMDTGAFIVRSSYARGEKSQTGGMSMIVHPGGEIASNAEQNIGTFYAEIDPHEKWLRPKSFGQPAVSAREIVKIHQRLGVYMPEKVLLSKPFPHLVAHQGFSKACPANTLPAFGTAVALGADEIELDVHPSADGELVVMHDATLDRTTDLSGAIIETRWEEIARADAGAKFGDQWRGVRVPRLENVWEAFAGQAEFNIHIKNPGEDGYVIRRTKELAEKYGITEQIYLAGDRDVMEAGLQYAPEIARCCLVEQSSWNLVDNGIRYQCQRVQFFNKYCDTVHIQKAHEAGLSCNLYFADDPDEAKKYFQMGIDSILTNALAETLPAREAMTYQT